MEGPEEGSCYVMAYINVLLLLEQKPEGTDVVGFLGLLS